MYEGDVIARGRELLCVGVTDISMSKPQVTRIALGSPAWPSAFMGVMYGCE
jgi:hypothetical protein